MSEPFLLKGKELSNHIDDCINTLNVFKKEAERTPDFEIDIGLQFIVAPNHSEVLNRLLQEHFGDEAVLEGIESFEEETKFLH